MPRYYFDMREGDEVASRLSPPACSLNPFCARISARDQALRSKEIDGVIGHTLHEEAKLLLVSAKFGFGGSPLGQVACDLGVADELAFAVPYRVDDDIGPEPAAVLRDAPAFTFEFAFAGCCLKSPARQAGFANFLGIETGKMFAEDFGIQWTG
jgi:hypothetical protein